MTSAGKAMQVMVTCQQLFQTGLGGLALRVRWSWAGSAPPVQVTVKPAALVLHPCPSGKDLSRAGGVGVLVVPVAGFLQGAGTWILGPHGLLPFPKKSVLGSCLELAAFQLVILEMFPKIQARRLRVSWGEGCFLLETQGPGGLNIPQFCHALDLPRPSSEH